jgi:hypothetical protein
MAIPAAAWESATPVFGIRYPKPTAPAKYLPDMFQHTGVDVEQALLTDQTVPPGLAYRTGTKAERLAATPAKDLVWVETDTGDQYIGTGTGSVGTVAPVGGAVLSPGTFLRAAGGLAEFGFNIAPTTGASWSAATLVATIPVGFRPVETVSVIHQSYNAGFANAVNVGQILTNGEVRVNQLALAAQTIARGYIKYLAA